jgi:ABC-2 type transport system ATP-binding protein
MMKTPWFARRRIGVGVQPVSWQGWTISLAALVLVVASFAVVHESSVRTLAVLAIAAVYLGIALATGGAKRRDPSNANGASSRAEETSDPSDRPQDDVTSQAPSRPDPSEALSIADIRSRLAPIVLAPTTESRVNGPVAIEVTHLTKQFGERTAFSDVTFSVAQGEVFGFLGPNGAGKTTTVRTLSTLIEATSGTAVVAGIPVCEENGVEIRQRISVMPEVPGLYSRLSVTDNLEFFVGLYGLGDAKSRIARALEAVNLSTRANDVCASLSKGLRQRVSIARALLNDPEIIFLDEPTSGLDPVATREVSELIDSLRARGVTIFLTTHRLEEAERLCDRVAILNTTLRIVGRTSELRRQLFKSSLLVATLGPLENPDRVFSAIGGIDSWQSRGGDGYELLTSDPKAVAPEVVRALVGAGADVLSIGESRHSLEDVYLQLVGEDVEVRS